MVRSGRWRWLWRSMAQARGSKAWMWCRRASGDWRGVELSGRKDEAKTIGGGGWCDDCCCASEWQNLAWTKKITSRRYAGHPTQDVFSRRLNAVGPSDGV